MGITLPLTWAAGASIRGLTTTPTLNLTPTLPLTWAGGASVRRGAAADRRDAAQLQTRRPARQEKTAQGVRPRANPEPYLTWLVFVRGVSGACAAPHLSCAVPCAVFCVLPLTCCAVRRVLTVSGWRGISRGSRPARTAWRSSETTWRCVRGPLTSTTSAARRPPPPAALCPSACGGTASQPHFVSPTPLPPHLSPPLPDPPHRALSPLSPHPLPPPLPDPPRRGRRRSSNSTNK